MWQALRETIRPKGAELITVGMDTLGADGCAPAIKAANAAQADKHRLEEQRPPGARLPVSKTVGSMPSSFSRRAHARPATPPPITATD